MGDMQGTRVEVEITGVAHGGVFVARHEGRVIFVSDAIPGETVLAEITDDAKPKFWRAETVKVLTPSEHRRPHVWDAASIEREPADRAGGAEFGHIALPHQRELKRQVLADALSRMAKQETDVTVEPLPSGNGGGVDSDGTGWRTRIRLHVAEDGTPGPYASRSHRVVPVTDVPLAVAEAQAILPLDERFPGAEFVDVVVPSVGNAFVLVGDRKNTRRASRILERVGDREFRLEARGFWQVHRHAATTLTEAVQSAVDEALFDPRAANLDLYGGVGLLAAAVGDRFGDTVQITTVESDPTATTHAAANLTQWPGASAVTGRVERYLQKLRASAGAGEKERLARATVVLDPPRAGAGKAVVNELAALSPAQLVYVACDPVALARDVALLAGHGYALSTLRAFDLFPNTHHVEAVATFVRR
ncbi:MAG TPA: TRAM domain-containing protein [Marisediminicola sp.]|jgi:tRNA/tmRNA/rRNA uracil-C5-methylase (TrmA/RlmC/RlmD family)|nr:TRAM domain-containing protein [Marisediminicola sp.]